MEIVHVAAELTPIAKVGGLADVVHGLARAQLAMHHSVEVVLPKYDLIDLTQIEHLHVFDNDLPTFYCGMWHSNRVWKGIVDSIPVIFLESLHPSAFFNRCEIYGCEDDPDRFIYFSLAACEYFLKWKKEADIVHLHDWHVALIAALMKTAHKDFKGKIILTIHNLIYQGICDEKSLDTSGIQCEKLHEGKHINLLKGGIHYADYITTVSPRYAQQILHSSEPLAQLLRHNQHKFKGILNGIDQVFWDPATDRLLPEHFSAHKKKGKETVKQRLRKQFGLADEKTPIVSAVTRLTHQKGPEFLKAAVLRTLELGGQFVLLGSVMEEEISSRFYSLKQKLAKSPHVHFEFAYNEELSHLVFGGSDLIVVPSLFEPCGLTQLIALRYGTLPLVHETGGLADTVTNGKNGFTFREPTLEAFNIALDSALTLWFTQPDQWENMVDVGMRIDYSWRQPAEEYLKIYHNVRAHAGAV